MDPILREALIAAGWYEGRKVDITEWVNRLEHEGFVMHDGARNALAEFGGIRLRPNVGSTGGSLWFDPYEAASGLSDEADVLHNDYGEVYSPIGMWSAQYVAYLGESGRVLSMGPGLDWELGTSLENALEFVAHGRHDVICVRNRSTG